MESISRHVMSLVINSLGGNTDICIEIILRNQVYASPRPACAWRLVNKGISGNDNGKAKTLLTVSVLNCCYSYVL